MRKLGVNCRTAWLLHNNKIMQAMSEREKSYILRGKVQNDRRDGLPQQQAPQGHEIERVNAGGHGPQHRSGGDFGSGFCHAGTMQLESGASAAGKGASGAENRQRQLETVWKDLRQVLVNL
jgi:hypothetical protein